MPCLESSAEASLSLAALPSIRAGYRAAENSLACVLKVSLPGQGLRGQNGPSPAAVGFHLAPDKLELSPSDGTGLQE